MSTSPLHVLPALLFFALTAACTSLSRKEPFPLKPDTSYYEIHDTFRLSLDHPSIDSLITKTDTLHGDRSDSASLTLRDYDKADRIIRTRIYDLPRKEDVFTTIYDSNSRTIYEEHVSKDIRWQAYRSTYDSLGYLIHKEGYGSGDMGSKLTFVMDGGKVKQITTEKPGSMRIVRF